MNNKQAYGTVRQIIIYRNFKLIITRSITDQTIMWIVEKNAFILLIELVWKLLKRLHLFISL
jgi:hypothetical protein